MEFEMIPVTSSTIAAVGYDPMGFVLRVDFNNGAKWIYHNVRPEAHQAMMAAPSIGSYFHANIKKVYGQARLG